MHQGNIEKENVSYCYIILIYPVQLIDKHRDVLDKAKSDYNKMKRTVDDLRASEVLC